MADQTATLIRREEVAEGTMAFHFERPSGFSFRAGQFADVINGASREELLRLSDAALRIWPK